MTVNTSCHRFPVARRQRGAAALVLVLAMAAAAGTASAQSDDEIIRSSEQVIEDREAERQELQQAAADATDSLDAATADAEDLVEALTKAQEAVDSQYAARDEAARAVVEARAVVAEAESTIAELEAELRATEDGLREAVIDAYVSFQAPSGTFGVLESDPWDNAHQEALTGFVTGNRLDDIDELRRLGEELERWRLLAADAAAEAEQVQQEREAILAELAEAEDREAALSLQAEERVERRLYEVQNIRLLDADLAAEIEAAERQVAAALERQRAAEQARRRAAEEARRRAEAEAARNRGEQAPPTGPQAPDGAEFTLVWVRGFQVNSTIAGAVEGLVAAMDAEGFDLGGWGYRTPQRQIELRRAHCGTSEWAIWQMPSHQCRPPTARPGRSNHETGEAIDFTNNGRLITSRSSAVFQALQRLAPGFGLHNLPSEPWHWSVDGR